jgi:hypothetical protein
MSVALSPHIEAWSFPGEFKKPRAGYMLGQIAAALHADGHIFGSVYDQCWYPDRRENVADVDLAIHSHVCCDGCWRCTEPLEATKPALECRIVGTRQYEEWRGNAAAPGLANITEKLGKSLFGREPRGKARR